MWTRRRCVRCPFPCGAMSAVPSTRTLPRLRRRRTRFNRSARHSAVRTRPRARLERDVVVLAAAAAAALAAAAEHLEVLADDLGLVLLLAGVLVVPGARLDAPLDEDLLAL